MIELLSNLSLASLLKLLLLVVVISASYFVIISIIKRKVLKVSVLLTASVVFYYVLSNVMMIYSGIAVYITYGSLVLPLLFFFVSLIPAPKSNDPFRVPILLRNGATIFLENLKRGLVIFGSAGSGKTESWFVQLLKHLGRLNVPALVYDLKDGELTEIAMHFYKDSTINRYIIAPHRPHISDCINPFEPKYIKSEQHLRQKTKLIFANLRKAEGVNNAAAGPFFDKIPEPTLAAVLWRLKEDYPQYCTLPHAVSFCLNRNPMDIAHFISQNVYSRQIGQPLIDSLQSTDQVTGVKASLSLPLTDLSVPTLFWIMRGNEVDMDLNNPEHPSLICVMNDPNSDRANAPFISVIVSSIIDSMKMRHMLPSYLLLDEATSFYLDGFSQIPAQMRSYNIATVFSTQDMSLSVERYGKQATSSILANLSYQVIGKANDPESIRYYKSISSEVEKKTVSKSFTDGLVKGDTRTSEGTRETSKFKNQDFSGLGQGDFYLFADGKESFRKLGLVPFEREELKQKYFINDYDINENYKRIISEALSIK